MSNSVIHKTQKRKYYKRLGLCRCGRKPNSNRKTCERCYLYDKQREQKRLAKKVCRCCEQITIHGNYCDKCKIEIKNYMKKYFKKRTDKGLCKCGRKTKYWWKKTCERCLKIRLKAKRTKAAIYRKLFRPVTKEEKDKYNMPANQILKKYYDLFY